MAETHNYQMAIDLLCCHLGISEEEAKQQLGICAQQQVKKHVAEAHQTIASANQDN
ncbi:hypothetical protein GCM10007938_30960 [Vibrio zhanjiangensis]|uniref:Heat-shock protein HtpX n=1 Tax=Vibrio zhanjiangensis TaxID=1046128 RepID=A0ABQ6F263_9VIBR|nr:hypothetical protein [Vibrio zhanjiangensis]GLT19314.1 hypothetical protein GCM10007938_30960 [Vibrio zhanjiangensis]